MGGNQSRMPLLGYRRARYRSRTGLFATGVEATPMVLSHTW
jgi:hypothetical protein